MRRRPRLAHTVAAAGGLLALLCAPAAWAATILIDFNDRYVPAATGWNTFSEADAGTIQSLVLDDGSASGASLVLPDFRDSAAPGWNNPLPAWAPTEAADDFSYFNNATDGGSEVAQFVFSGLDPASVYSIDLIASRNLGMIQDVSLTHGGGVASHDDWNLRTDGWQAGGVLSFGGLTPDGANEMVMQIRREGFSAAFNAIRITYVPAPEPSTFVLTSLGLVLLAAQRRSARRRA